ncbi:hypothetical protein E1262_25690 [Jiangella aurantiaca]|uniref:Carboxypeptidase regulatory-like domain-containing protein n=1 Tax=Jiangella aurantiaca TaxID=2530373 RepID=A0A4R5A0N5_9ACTN|nr:hypothetical protein [Jiangella aurantiaca]TDD65261.1 hypothetical protein E1262_25690 [Jiangella aurantiaca]
MAHRTPAAVVVAVLFAACSSGERDAADPSALPAPTPAASATPTATLVPGIPDSAQLSEPVVVRGRVLRADGTAVAEALVQLTTEPTDEQLATIDPFLHPLTPVAATSSGPDGRYELRIPAGRRTELPVDEAGLVQFVVLVESPEGSATEFWTGPGEPTHPHTVDLEVRPDS